MGHWDLFVDQTMLGQPGLPGLSSGEGFVQRGSAAGAVQVLQALLRDPDGVDLVRDLMARADDPAEARAVNRYAAAISMPRGMIRGLVAETRPARWRELYRLAERFEVTITALRVRLDQLGLLHVAQDGRLYASRGEAAGQMKMW
jgi:Zn-dependent peptidase ImmA (M78 family)